MEYLDVDWRTDQFADLLFGDYLNREDKVWHEFAVIECSICSSFSDCFP